MDKSEYILNIPSEPEIIRVMDINNIQSFIAFCDAAISSHPFVSIAGFSVIMFFIYFCWKPLQKISYNFFLSQYKGGDTQ